MLSIFTSQNNLQNVFISQNGTLCLTRILSSPMPSQPQLASTPVSPTLSMNVMGITQVHVPVIGPSYLA